MKKSILLLLFSICIAYGVGLYSGKLLIQKPKSKDENLEQAGSSEKAKYTCSMHPQIQLLDKDAKCPLCGMALIPVSQSSASDSQGLREIKLSQRAQKLAEIETAVVERKYVTTEVRMAGKIEYDESRIAYITARVPGRLERLFVDYTGIKVKKGDHLVQIYSPELYTAQEELIQAIATANNLSKSTNEFIKEQSLQNIKSAREKLTLWGLSDEQIKELEKDGSASERVTFKSPIEGVTVEKKAVEGMYVNTGTEIYKIADLSKVWVKLDAYESDLPWIHFGQEVEFYTEAYPGEIFKGQIAFIDPVLNAKTRTVKIRVNLPNPNEKLKPDMFVRAIVKSRIAKGGKVMEPGLQGKWISPMHPEIIKDAPGECDICGMDLVSAESLGYVSVEGEDDQKPLVVPASAPLITGKRAVVYVEKSPGVYEGRDVVLGTRASDYYIVEKGLQAGERVVVNGNFKIDSAIQILAKPSMMNPPSEDAPQDESHHDHFENHTHLKTLTLNNSTRTAINEVMEKYYRIQFHLSRDDLEEAQKSTESLKSILEVHQSTHENDPGLLDWAAVLNDLSAPIELIIKSDSLTVARSSFHDLSGKTISMMGRIKNWDQSPVFQYHCPMAFKGKGASWLQPKKGTENPYYGSAMFKCGSLQATFN